MACRE